MLKKSLEQVIRRTGGLYVICVEQNWQWEIRMVGYSMSSIKKHIMSHQIVNKKVMDTKGLHQVIL